MRKRNKLILVLAAILLITASTAAYLQISNKKRDSLKTSTQIVKTEKPSEISSPIEDPQALPTISSAEVEVSPKWGNTPSNISNGGYFAVQDGYLYFDTGNVSERIPSIDSTKISRTKEDGITGLTLLGSRPYARNINVVGDWLYYTSMDNIWKEKINGEGLESIKSGPITQLIIHDNIMYYLKDNILEKCSIDTPEYSSTLITNVSYFMLSEDGKNIIYIDIANYSDSVGSTEGAKLILHKIDIEGKNKRNILELPIARGIGSIMTFKNYIYLMTSDDLASDENPIFSIYRINTDYSQPGLERFIDGSQFMDLSSMNISAKYLYYLARPIMSNSYEIHRRDLDTNEEEIVATSNTTYATAPIHIFDNKAYFIGGSIGQEHNYSASMFWVDFDKKTIKENKGYK
jgi:hypothetical protein